MYYLIYGFFYLLSLLPMPLLHGISSGFYLVIYRLLGYRKKVVLHNLAIAFPQKSEAERERIARQFYKNFTDTFIETIKLLSASDAFIRKRFVFNVEVLDELYRKGKKCQVHLGHNFNWELGNLGTALQTKHLMLSIYMPINSAPFERLFKKIRTRTGAVMLPATRIKEAFPPYKNELYLLALVADQNPGNPHKSYWANFFGRPTPFTRGPETTARANNNAVVFCFINKKRRGYYEARFELATEEPRALKEGELTLTYIRYLEDVIRAAPDMWLWSHRRWKHQWQGREHARWIDTAEPGRGEG